MKTKALRRPLSILMFAVIAAIAIIGLAIFLKVQYENRLKRESLLIAAVDKGNVDAALRLLDQGTNPNTVCDFPTPTRSWEPMYWRIFPPLGGTVLNLAVSGAHSSDVQISRLVRALLEKGADPRRYDTSGRSVLTGAVLFGHYASVQAVVDAGVDVNERDTRGRTALDWLRFKATFEDEKFIAYYREKVTILKKAGAK